MAFGLSLQSGVVYVVAGGRAVIRGLLARLALLALVQTLLAVGLLVILLNTGLSAALVPPDSAWWSVSAIALMVFFGLLSGHFRSVLTGLQRIPLVNNIGLSGQVFVMVAILVVILLAFTDLWRFSVIKVVWIQVIGVILMTFVLFWFIRPYLIKKIDRNNGFREVVSISFPSYLANLVQTLNYRLDLFFVSYYVDMRGVGLYALAVGLAQLLWLISGAASQVLFPDVAASTDRKAAQERTAYISRISLWLSIFLAAGVAIIGNVLLPLIYGDSFRDSVPALMWLLPGVVVFSVPNVIGSFLAGIGKPRLNLMGSFIGFVATIVLDFALIPGLGIIGAAIASSISYMVTMMVIMIIFARETNFPLLSSVLLTRGDITLLFVALRRISRGLHAAQDSSTRNLVSK